MTTEEELPRDERPEWWQVVEETDPRRPWAQRRRLTTKAILDFEHSMAGRISGQKDAQIREVFGVTPTRYYQALNHRLDDPVLLRQALEVDPMLVRRLLRLRDERAEARAGRSVPPIGGDRG